MPFQKLFGHRNTIKPFAKPNGRNDTGYLNMDYLNDLERKYIKKYYFVIISLHYGNGNT